MEKKRAILCIGITFGLNLLCILPFVFLRGNTDGSGLDVVLLAAGFVFMWFPTIAAIITKKVTKDSYKVGIRPHIKSNKKHYIQAALLPGLLIFVGATAYFLLFPNDFDLTFTYVRSLAGDGFTPPFTLTIPIVTLVALGAILLAPLVFVNHIFGFGEEYGWRGYILPKLQSFMSDRKAVVISSLLWGLGHAPLVCYGLNYYFDYPGFPYSGILMMTLFAAVIGVWLSYMTIRTKSVIAASIAHGAINAIRELPAFVAVSGINTLIGPKPSGIIGLVGFIVLSFICLYKMREPQRK
jgi:membrane protease YdiL (CAAX protease family)